MRFQTLVAATAALFLALPALADGTLTIKDAYARSMGGMGAAGAIFFEIDNPSDTEDRLIDVTSDVAEKTEIHTHKEDANGVMQMLHVTDGLVIPAQGSHALARGGDHVMLKGLTREIKDGDMVHLTLTFEHAGIVEVDVPVNNTK